MKLIKFLLTTLVSFFILAAIAITLLIATIDPNDQKALITSGFQQATGRDLNLAGDLNFTFFPKLGIQLGQAQVSNAYGFGQAPFAEVDNVVVSADVLSLLRLKLSADAIQLHGLRINLHKNKQGQNNWQDLLETENDAANPQSKSASKLLGIDIAGIKVTDAHVVYHDQQAENTITLEQLEFVTGRIGGQSSSPMRMAMNLRQTNPSMTGRVQISSNMMLHVAAMRLVLDDLKLTVDARSDAFIEQEIALDITARIELDLQQETLSASQLTIDTQQQNVTGQLALKSFSQPRVNFSLHADQLDLDKLIFLAPADHAEATHDTIELPVAALRKLTLFGDLRVSRLRASGLEMTDITAKLSAQQGVLTIDPLTMDVYQGQYTGSAQLDVSGSTPQYQASSELQQLAIGDLLRALSDNKKSFIRGQSSMSFAIKTSGKSVTDLKKQLRGTLAFNAADGALQSENLARNIEYVMAFLQGRTPKPSGQEIIFDTFAATGVITHGVFSNDDLILTTPLLSATGAGQVDIPSSSIAYALGVGLAPNSDRQLPIQIEGPLAKPKYSVDIKSAMSGQQKQQLVDKKQEIEEKLLEGIGEKLGDDVKKKLKQLKLF